MGVESDLIYLASESLSLYAAFSYNHTELTAAPPGIIDQAPVGSELALTPELQINARARYDWVNKMGNETYWQAGVQHASDSWSSIVAADRYSQSRYTTADFAVGTTFGNWSGELFVENLTDERAELFINTQDKTLRTMTNRPRTIGLRFAYRY